MSDCVAVYLRVRRTRYDRAKRARRTELRAALQQHDTQPQEAAQATRKAAQQPQTRGKIPARLPLPLRDGVLPRLAAIYLFGVCQGRWVPEGGNLRQGLRLKAAPPQHRESLGRKRYATALQRR